MPTSGNIRHVPVVTKYKVTTEPHIDIQIIKYHSGGAQKVLSKFLHDSPMQKTNWGTHFLSLTLQNTVRPSRDVTGNYYPAKKVLPESGAARVPHHWKVSTTSAYG